MSAGVEVVVEGLTKSFGPSLIWSDVTLTLPAGEISVLLGPSGTGKAVFLKSLIGLLKPEKGSIFIHDTDLVRCSEHKLYEIRKLFGVLFQDGALFGSMNHVPVADTWREQDRQLVMEEHKRLGKGTGNEQQPLNRDVSHLLDGDDDEGGDEQQIQSLSTQ